MVWRLCYLNYYLKSRNHSATDCTKKDLQFGKAKTILLMIKNFISLVFWWTNINSIFLDFQKN
ncbi:MAG: hypothetical protein CFE25_05245 [Chitinophagaceae bacterium BSSC1]|nr:MAG: hypothetical protein CFE25_05245 [Chitinophagaceae bacterium BSSC1]